MSLRIMSTTVLTGLLTLYALFREFVTQEFVGLQFYFNLLFAHGAHFLLFQPLLDALQVEVVLTR